MDQMVNSALDASSISYGDAIDLLEGATNGMDFGTVTVFSAEVEGRRVIVVINQLDSESCVKIAL